MRQAMQEIRDLQRLNARIAHNRCNARDLVALKHSIESLPEIRALLNKLPSPLFERITSKWDDLADVAGLVDDAISDDPPLTTREGGMIKPGFDEGLDELIRRSRDG